MSAAARRERERAQRHALIIQAARELAEAEGWEAVTTRRLAERVEYSQPVLYSHFDSKEAIMRAVAIEGFAELAVALHRARLAAAGPRQALRAVCGAYMGFAAAQPALYQAMFVLPTHVKFASDETPAPLREAFSEIVSVVSPYAARTEIYAEVIWSTLHGMVVLASSGRIPAHRQAARLDLLVDQAARRPARARGSV